LPAKIAGVNRGNHAAFAVFDGVEHYSFGGNQHNQFKVSGSGFRILNSELRTI